jgi:hypothetical protein
LEASIATTCDFAAGGKDLLQVVNGFWGNDFTGHQDWYSWGVGTYEFGAQAIDCFVCC